jgi:hypothetical protein
MSRDGTVTGKAILVMDRIDSMSGRYQWDINILIQSCSDSRNGEYARDFVVDTFWCVEYDTTHAPPQAYKMKIGERIAVAVTYVIDYGVDYWGEGWEKLEYKKSRVLRRSWPKERYISKTDRLKWEQRRKL